MVWKKFRAEHGVPNTYFVGSKMAGEEITVLRINT